MDATIRTNNSSLTGSSATGETMLNKAVANVHGAVDAVAGAADDAARKVKPAIERVADVAHQAVEKVAGAAAPTAAWLGEQGDNLNATRRKVTADTMHYVSANPWKSLGIALAAGFVISRVIR